MRTFSAPLSIAPQSKLKRGHTICLFLLSWVNNHFVDSEFHQSLLHLSLYSSFELFLQLSALFLISPQKSHVTICVLALFHHLFLVLLVSLSQSKYFRSSFLSWLNIVLFQNIAGSSFAWANNKKQQKQCKGRFWFEKRIKDETYL